MRAMQSPKWLVGCIKVSGRRRADPSIVESDSYNLSVCEKSEKFIIRRLLNIAELCAY
jgi:hypothetical protein